MGCSWTRWSLSGLKGIEPFEVLQVLDAERRWPHRAHSPSGVTVLTIWARTRGGRPLIVAVRQVSEREWLIVGARDMHLQERAEFVRWEEAQDG
jgi:hypothetical protein